MAFLLNLLYKSTALYLKQPLYIRIFTLVCVLALFVALVYVYPVSYVVGDVAEVTPLIDNVAVEKVPRTLAASSSTPAAPARAPLCSELPCRMRDSEYVRRYVHNLSVERTARETFEHAFQQYYVTYQGDLHKREVFLEVERWVRAYPEMPEHNRDAFARVYSELRAQRYRMLYAQSH